MQADCPGHRYQACQIIVVHRNVDIDIEGNPITSLQDTGDTTTYDELNFEINKSFYYIEQVIRHDHSLRVFIASVHI